MSKRHPVIAVLCLKSFSIQIYEQNNHFKFVHIFPAPKAEITLMRHLLKYSYMQAEGRLLSNIMFFFYIDIVCTNKRLFC